MVKDLRPYVHVRENRSGEPAKNPINRMFLTLNWRVGDGGLHLAEGWKLETYTNPKPLAPMYVCL